MNNANIAGAGIGLRTPHAQEILANPDLKIPWLEILADNWMAPGGLNRKLLEAISERFPTVLHGVGLSLGSTMPLDIDYVQSIKRLKRDTGAVWYSEHASFSSYNGHYFPDLLPMLFTEESVAHLSQRIVQVQDILGERILLENISAYVACPGAEMSEGQFIREVAESADCGLLLDINNLFVSSQNFHCCADDFLKHLPWDRVRQIHLAGFEDKGDFLLDAHNQPVAPAVWQLFERLINEHGPIPSMIEWDSDIPPLARLLEERSQAQRVLDQYRDKSTDAA